MPFTLRNIKEDLEDVGSRFDGAPDLEFRLATEALELEKSGLGFQSCALARARAVSLAAQSVRPGYWPGDEQGVHDARSG